MKNLFKIAICVSIIMTLSSCFGDPELVNCRVKSEYFAGNYTNKEIVIVCVLSNEYEAIARIEHCTLSWDKQNNITEMCLYLPAGSPLDSVFSLNYRFPGHAIRCQSVRPWFEKFIIYNLDDTTSVDRSNDYGFGDNTEESFVEASCDYHETNSYNSYWDYIVKLTVTDSLLSLMEKDTTMLSLFPEYYGNQNPETKK